MNKNILTLLFFFLFISMASGQDWLYMQKEGSTFDEIKLTMDKKFKGKSTLKNVDNYDSEYKKYARWEYYWRYQTNSLNNFVSPSEVWNAWEESKKSNLNSGYKMATANWSYLGPDTIPTATAVAYAGMGRLNTIAFHPNNTDTFWVGSANGGLWKTTDGGATWASAGGDLPVLGVSDIAISNTGNTIYIATGDADGGHSTSVGVLKSTDGGATFSPTGLMNTATSDMTAAFQIHHLWVDPTNEAVVVATTTSNIQRTINGGSTWTVVENNPASDLKQDPNNSNILYAGSIDAIIKSTDGGATWGATLKILTGAEKIDIALSAANSSVVYMISDNAMGAKSTDGGTTWTAPFNMPAGFNTQGGYDMGMVVAPNDANKVMMAGVSGWVSSDGGVNWTQHLNGVYGMMGDPGKYVHSDHHMLKYMPGSNSIIFIAHDGGLHKGDFHNLAATWTDLSHGLFITQYYGMDGFPGDAGILIGGAQDNDGSFLKENTWKNINNNSDGTGGVIDFNNAAISYCKSQSGFLSKTTDSWATSYSIGPNPTSSDDKADFVWPLVMNPVNSNSLYAGYGNIYKSTDKGENWSNLTNESDPSKSYSSISVAKTDTMRIYAIRSSVEIKRSNDGGSTWSMLNPPSGTSGAKISSIKVSLTDETIVYLTYGNYTAGAKVFMSTNSGDAWTNISTGIPNMPTFTITEKVGGDLYLGTQLGIYERASGTTTWTAFNTNMPAVAVTALDIHEASSVLRAATYGRGIWKSSLSASGGCPSMATHNWTGTTNTDWNTATNWDTGCVPASTNAVVIPNVTNDPIISNGMTGSADNVSISAGGNLTVQNGGTLQIVAKNVIVDAMGLFTAEAGAVITVAN